MGRAASCSATRAHGWVRHDWKGKYCDYNFVNETSKWFYRGCVFKPRAFDDGRLQVRADDPRLLRPGGDDNGRDDDDDDDNGDDDDEDDNNDDGDDDDDMMMKGWWW